MRYSLLSALFPGSRKAAAIALCFALSGCATYDYSSRASLGGFGVPSFRDAPKVRGAPVRPRAPSPGSQQTEECGQADPAKRLLCKGVIGGRQP